MIDGYDIVGGEGPMAPTRCGAVPVSEFIEYAEGKSAKELRALTTRNGGFVSHLGTSALLYGQVREADQILEEYDRVTREQLRALAGELFTFERASLSAVGRTEQAEEYVKMLPLNF